MPKKKRLICDVHDEIKEYALDIEALVDDLDVYKKCKHPINKILKKIIADAKEAKGYGQTMEDRMSEYREAIEHLGFTRDKN